MRMQLYAFLVNRHSEIRERYHRYRDYGLSPFSCRDIRRGGKVDRSLTAGQSMTTKSNRGGNRILAWGYLLWLNLAYCFGGLTKQSGNEQDYESCWLYTDRSESNTAWEKHLDADGYVTQLAGFDVISFDIFDTLLFRPFSDPRDLFRFFGTEFGILDLGRIRMEQEVLARQDCHALEGHGEVDLEGIWRRMERETGIPAVRGMAAEMDLEERFCHANPFMRQVLNRLQAMGKEVIAVSDMYLSGTFLADLLEKNGCGVKRVYVSCEYGAGKADGGLFNVVRRDFGEGVSIAHVGDNPHSDVEMALKQGIAALHYPNVHTAAAPYRPWDMSPVVGGAYRGVVGQHLYSGTGMYSMEYEYGFVYGGLFVLGYCHFIHEYCQRHGVERVLFLARDGDILKQAYDRMYPEEDTAYVYWSRSASVSLMAEYDRHDYFRRDITHRAGTGISVHDALVSMGLEDLEAGMEAFCKRQDAQGKSRTIHPGDRLDSRNGEILKEYLLTNFDRIRAYCREQQAWAKAYISEKLAGVSHAAAVDIGWAGSGALGLSCLAARAFGLSCRITGILAGTNTIHNAEPDAAEIFLQEGKLVSYLFSQSHNRDVMKRHDPSKNYNIYWELLLASPSRQFLGFGPGRGESSGPWAKSLQGQGCLQESEVSRPILRFGKADANQEGIREIQRGILECAPGIPGQA